MVVASFLLLVAIASPTLEAKAREVDGFLRQAQLSKTEPAAEIAALPPVRFLPLQGERTSLLGNKSSRKDADLKSVIFAEGAHAILTVVCTENSPTSLPARIEKLSVEVTRIDQRPGPAPFDITNMKALGDTAVNRLNITLDGPSVVNAFWKDMVGRESFVRAMSYNDDLLNANIKKVVDLSCKDGESWTTSVDMAQRREGTYKLRFLAVVRSSVVYSDPIYVERAAAR